MNSDHRSKFSNLSNSKKKPEKKSQDFNGIRTRDLRDTGVTAGAMLYRKKYFLAAAIRRPFLGEGRAFFPLPPLAATTKKERLIAGYQNY